MAAPVEFPERDSSAPRRRLYTKPPVVEAFIDIHVDRPSHVEAAALTAGLSSFHKDEEHLYPVRNAIMSGTYTVDPVTGHSTEQRQDLIGYRFISARQSEVVQVRKNGFTFSKVRPYTHWEQWRPEARRLWSRYCDLVHPIRVTRTTVRYINRIEIPEDQIHIENYFRTYPRVADIIPGAFARFLLRVELPQPDIPDAILVLSQGIVEDLKVGGGIVLDLELSCRVDMAPRDEGLWDALETLHDRENDAFEGCITDETRKLFE
jgi:uncharacterized protein (TIGR04255 family)